MRTTYGSPLFAEQRPGARLAARRAPARGGRDRDRQDEHARVRRGLADLQRRLRRDAQPVRPHAHARRLERRRGGRRRGRDAAVRRRVRPRRERPQPRRVLQPRRPAPLPRPDPGRRAGRSLEPAAGARGDRAHAARRRAAVLQALAGPDPRDPLSIPEPFAVPDLRPRSAGAADRLEPRPRRPAGRPRGDRRARDAPRDAGGARLRRRGRRAGLRGRRRVLRGAARRDVRRRVPRARRQGQADAGREHPLRALADARADRARRSSCAASCSRACASSSSATTRSPRP